MLHPGSYSVTEHFYLSTLSKGDHAVLPGEYSKMAVWTPGHLIFLSHAPRVH